VKYQREAGTEFSKNQGLFEAPPCPFCGAVPVEYNGKSWLRITHEPGCFFATQRSAYTVQYVETDKWSRRSCWHGIRCFQCVYWGGDKEKVQLEFKNNPISMDLFNGWPEHGDCSVKCEWAELEVFGNATARLMVAANFSCPYGITQ